MNYYKTIEEEAKDFTENYRDDIIDVIKENKDEDADYIYDEAIYQKWDLNDKIFEWLDTAWYGFLRREFFKDCTTELMSAAKILDESIRVETDEGIWEGQEPVKAIMSQAFYTVYNDLYNEIEKQIKEMINKELKKLH